MNAAKRLETWIANRPKLSEQALKRLRKEYKSEELFTLKVKTEKASETIVIVAYDANYRDPVTGHQRIDVEVRQGGRTIFQRSELYCAVNAWTTVDGIEAKALVMSLVAMKPGDTDREYFEGYTPEQLEWCERYGEMLGCEREMRYCDENGNVKRRGRR